MSESRTPTDASRLVNPTQEPVGKPHSGLSPLEGQTLDRDGPYPDEGPDYAAENKKLLEKLGKQGNEIGELRKQIAEIERIRQSVSIDADLDDYPDPAKMVHREIEPLKRELEELRTDRARAELKAHHADFEDIIGRDEFKEWVHEKKSRLLLAMAGDKGDVDSARELLDMYKEAIETGDSTPKQAVRRDRMVRAGASEKGSSRRPVGNVYKRSELQNLKAFNARRYQELLPDIRRAYAEGRVVD